MNFGKILRNKEQKTIALRVMGGNIINIRIGEDATMKRYMPMGGSILLISENSAYEPIQMNAEDVQINGKVIGVLKEKN